MPEMYLRQPGFRYCACGLFTEKQERMLKYKEIGITKYIYIFIETN